MEQLHDLIGKDCLDIILDYKKSFERVEENNRLIDDCIFEEHNKELFEKLFDMENYNEKVEQQTKRYYLNNMSIGEFKEYYTAHDYVQAVTFKFSIIGQTDDYFQTDIKKVTSDYLNNVNIKYIYKLNTFEICLFLGEYHEQELEELYKHIAYDIYEYPNQVQVIIHPRI